MTKLCKACEVLSFNDNHVGGYEKEDFDGNKILGFDDHDGRDDKAVKWNVLNYDHHDHLPELPRLAATAEAGCHFCSFLRAAIQRELRERNEWNDCEVEITLLFVWHRRSKLTDDHSKALLQNESLMALVAHLEIALPSGSFNNHKIYFITEALPGNCATWLRVRRPPWPNAFCPENISMMQEEIKNCIESCSHTEHKTAFVPTRLIDLIEPQTPRLVGLGDYNPRNDLDGMDIKYAALSYCWGPLSDASSMLKTEKISLQSRLAGIAIGEMPRVFQDAISLCHKLSIRYFWIDALCIVQDDRMDWQREASQMGKVYEGAFVTIVPLAAHTCNEGFLQRSQETIGIHFQSTIRPKMYGEFHLRHVPRIDTGEGWHFFDLDGMEIYSSTWRKRGWTFQEEILSTRILYFGQTVTFFRCHRWTRLESEDCRYLSPGLSFSAINWLSDPVANNEKWESVVRLFSDRRLSYAEDKLPAISALAQRFAEVTKDEYIAGLWRGNLLHGLLWYVEPKDEWESFLVNLETPNPYVAPSWSWASRNSYVDFGVRRYSLPETERGLTQECNIIDVEVGVHGYNSFGTVSNAVLSLSGKLAPLPSILQIMPSSFRSPTWKISKRSALLGVVEFDWITNGEESWKPYSVEMVMLLVASWGKGARRASGCTDKCAYGLILLPTGNGNEYRRVGVFYFGKGGEFSPDSPWDNRLFVGRRAQTIRLI